MARSMSDWYLSRMCSVAPASSSPISSRPSTTSVRAQSSVSETDGRLLQVERAQRAHDLGDLLGEGARDARDAREDDVAFALDVGVVDVQVQAAPLERLGELAGVVGREEHHRDLLAP